jgi:hypothetical protein
VSDIDDGSKILLLPTVDQRIIIICSFTSKVT